MSEMQYWVVEPPSQWQAGFVGSGETRQAFHFGCADCGAKEPPIAGIVSSDGTFAGIAVRKLENGLFNPAMFCAPCFAKRLEDAADRLEAPS